LPRAAIVGALAITWRLTTGRFEVRIVLFTVSLFSTFGSWSVRPQAFSMLLFPTTCALLAADRWWWLPLVFVVWVNLHAVGLIGVTTVAAAALARASMQRSRPRRDAAVLLACLVATTLSPLGAGVWLEALTSIRRSVSNQILEWSRPGFEPVNMPFWGLVVALPILAWVRRRTLDARTIALAGAALGITPLAVTTVRNVSLFVLVAVPAVAAVLASGRPEPRPRSVAERTGVNAMMVIAVAVFSAMTVWSIWARTPADIGWSPIQPAAVAAIRSCPGHLYNTFDQGGVLIWFVRDRPVFIDNRQDFYPANLLTRSRHVEFTGDYAELFRDYDVRCAVVPPGSLTAAALARDPCGAGNTTITSGSSSSANDETCPERGQDSSRVESR
jgi:hypothetical protein